METKLQMVRIILKLILEKTDVKNWIEEDWLYIMSYGEVLRIWC